MPERSARSTTRRASTDRSALGTRFARAATIARRAISGSAGTCVCITPLTDDAVGARIIGGTTIDGEDADEGEALCWRCGKIVSDE